MSKSKNRTSPVADVRTGQAGGNAKRPDRKKTLKTLLILAGASVLSCAVYFFIVANFGAEAQTAAVTVFLVLSCGMAILYFAVNRGLVMASATPEMLPDSMTPEEKEQAIATAAERKRKTRWMAAAVFALILPVLLDAFYLFVLEDLFPEGLLSWLK